MKRNSMLCSSSLAAVLFLTALPAMGQSAWAPRTTSLVTPGVAPDKATDAQKKDALGNYNAGTLALNLGKNEDALAKFRASYATIASPNSRMMIGRILAKLGRNVEAYRETQAAIEEADALAGTNPKYKASGESARADLAAVEPKVGLVNVALPSGADDGTLTINGDAVDLALVGRWIAVAPGAVTVAYETPKGRSERTADAPQGAKTPVLLPAIVPPKKKPAPVEVTEPVPVDTPKPEVEAAPSGNDRGAFVVGLKAGALASFNGLNPNVMGAVQVGYVLPFAKRAIGVMVDVGYAQPTTGHAQTDPRVDVGGYNWHIETQQLTLQTSVYYRATMLPKVGPGQLVPYAAFGPRVYMTKSRTSSDGKLPTLLEQTETSTDIGVGAHLGSEYLLGPGAIVAEALLGWAPIGQRSTGDATLTALSAWAGYRFLL